MVGWGTSGLLLIGRKQTVSIGNFTVGYFSFHAETNNMLSVRLKSLGSEGELSDIKGDSSEGQGKLSQGLASGAPAAFRPQRLILGLLSCLFFGGLFPLGTILLSCPPQ
jgi:hypothetical protein